MKKMKALSIQQPWAWAILHAGKDIENRTWPVPKSMDLPTRIVVHAGKKTDPEGFVFLRKLGIEPPANLPTGCLVGEIDITRCIDMRKAGKTRNPWAFGPYCFKLENPKAYKEPIPCRGQLGFFDVEVPDV